MNTLKSVFQKIAEDKTELAKHEVELALKDDLDKAYKEAIAARKKAEETFFNTQKIVEAAVQKALKEIKSYRDINANALPQFDKFKRSVKELGIDLPQVYVQNEENITSGLKGTFPNRIKALEGIKF